MDETKLNEFVGQMLGDLGGAFSVPLVRIGDRLGLYQALHESGPMTAPRTGARRRASPSATRASGCRIRPRPAISTYDPAAGAFTLPPEQAMVFADTDSPVYLQGAFDLAAVMMENQALVEPAFRTGKGVGWGDQSQCLFCTVGTLLPSGLSQQPRAVVAAGAGRRRWRSWSAARPWPMSAAGTASRP